MDVTLFLIVLGIHGREPGSSPDTEAEAASVQTELKDIPRDRNIKEPKTSARLRHGAFLVKNARSEKLQNKSSRIFANLRPEFCPEFSQNYFQERKFSPKSLEVLGRISLRTSGRKLRSGPPNTGKRSILAWTSGADVHGKTSV